MGELAELLDKGSVGGAFGWPTAGDAEQLSTPCPRRPGRDKPLSSRHAVGARSKETATKAVAMVLVYLWDLHFDVTGERSPWNLDRVREIATAS